MKRPHHSVLTWHQSKLPDTECAPGLSLEEGREGGGEAAALGEPAVLATRGETSPNLHYRSFALPCSGRGRPRSGDSSYAPQ